MNHLLKYEWKKIVCRRVNLIAMALGLLLIVISNIALIRNSSLSLNEKTHLTGLEAIRVQTEAENALTPELDEEFLTAFLRAYQQTLQAEATDLNYYQIAPKSNLYALIAANFSDWNTDWSWEDLAEIDTEPGLGFYERRMEKIDTLLHADYSFGNYTQAEQTYWMQKAQAVPTPFVWGSRETWNLIWESICSLIFQLFVLSICLAPVFSGEVSYRTDALILSSKHGRKKLIHAKIAAAFLFTLSYLALCALIAVGMNVCILGVEGWNLPVQLWNTIIPYQLNAAQACGLNLLAILLLSASLTAVSLLLSASCKSQIAVLAIDIALFFGSVFLQSSKGSGLWNHIVCLVPMHLFDLRTVLKTYIDYPLAGTVISYLGMIWIVYSLVTVVCTCGAGRVFRKYQVGK